MSDEHVKLTHVIACTDRTMANGIAGDRAHIISISADGSEIYVLVLTHDGTKGPFKLRAEDIVDPSRLLPLVRHFLHLQHGFS